MLNLKKFLLKLSIFVAISMVLFLFVRLYWLKAAKVYKDGARIICEEKREAVRSGKLGYKQGKKNVLFMGHSKILAGIIPDYFDAIMNGKTYALNLALPALPIGPHYFELKDYLKHNPPPEYIVLNLVPNASKHPHPIFVMLFEAYITQGIKFPEEVWSYMIHLKNKRIIMNYFYPRRIYRHFIRQYSCNLLTNNSDITKRIQKNTKIINQMIADRGYYFIKELAMFPDERLPVDFEIKLPPNSDKLLNSLKTPVESIFNDPYVNMFFELASVENIKILLIQAYRRTIEPLPVLDVSEVLMKKYSNVYIAENGWKIKYYQNSFFSDPHHTNVDGAKLYTKDIADEFKEVFGLL